MPSTPTASDYIAQKQLMPSEFRTADWAAVPEWIRERAFFSAAVDRARTLQTMRDVVQGMVDGRIGRTEAMKRLKMHLNDIGYTPEPGKEGSLQDLSSVRRMQVMLDTNVDMARGWRQRQDYLGSRLFPAMQLYRAAKAKVPRDWVERWYRAGQEVNWEGVAGGDEFIALTNSPIWVALSDFGLPYPPFAFGSHMWVRPVSLEKARALGLVPPAPSAMPEQTDGAPADPAPAQPEPPAAPEVKPEPQPVPPAAPEVTPEPKPEVKPEPQPVVKPEPKPQPLPEVKPATPQPAPAVPEQRNPYPESLNEGLEVDVRPLSMPIRKALLRVLKGAAVMGADGVLRHTDPNGSRALHWKEAGKVISEGLPEGQFNLQMLAFKLWVEDSSNFRAGRSKKRRVSHEDGSVTRDAIVTPEIRHHMDRLIKRIIPTRSEDADGGRISRALHFPTESKLSGVLRSLREGQYQARPGDLGESWTNNIHNIPRYANRKHNIILQCDSYHSRRRIDGLYQHIRVDKQYEGLPLAVEGESIMPASACFRVVKELPPVQNKLGGYDYHFILEEI